MSEPSRRSRSLVVRTSGALAVLCLVAAGCAPRTPSVDVARETARLLERDRAWAAAASAGTNADSVVAFWTDDARVVGPNDPTLEGKQAIHQMVAGGFATPGFHVTWTPEAAVVSASGDLGYTRGTNEFTVPNGSGGTMKVPGRYITVWRRGADGVWRCAEDYTTPMPPAAAAKSADSASAAPRTGKS
jgi:ketosteroid isomerase-like protein